MRCITALITFAFGSVLLSGCGATAISVSTGLVVADAAAVTALHRDVFDFLISGATGQYCSVVRLDRGKSYCRPIEPAPVPPAYCTRTLGEPECWVTPFLFANPPRGIADGPWALTPQQEANRVSPF